MTQSKEAELTTAVVLYAVRCLAEGDQMALRTMKFGPKELEALRELSLADLYRIERLQTHCLSIELNRQIFWPTIEQLKQQRQSEETQQALIVADAPQDMMRTLFGMSAREYTQWRRTLTLAPSVGRPAELEESDNHRLWYVWESMAGDDDACLSGEDYLSLYRETDLPMRGIWILTQRWGQFGGVSIVGDVTSGDSE